MERKDAIVTGSVAGLAVVTAAAAVAVNLGLVGQGAAIAGTLGVEGGQVAVTDAVVEGVAADGGAPSPTDVETVYIDVYDVARTGGSAGGGVSTTPDEVEDGSWDEPDHDDSADEWEHEEDEREEHEYEGRDDDD